ncbi:MAG TPA: toxin-antitoxin system HicB family antitoxin [Rhodospirillaceae bacterium]|nr:toxin-antitoxin system HicB family antitoxin [Rhodospirillaceae bacterium]
MATLTIRMPEDKVNRLKELAKSRGISVNKLMEEWATMGIAEFDAHASFLARAARGSRERGLAALRELDARDRQSPSAGHSLHDHSQRPYEHKKDDK